jgi:hypothetical protein
MDLREINHSNKHRHPWEIVRANLIIKKISKYNIARVIDIGSGDCYLGSRIMMECNVPVLFIDKSFSDEQLISKSHLRSIDPVIGFKTDLLLLADVLEHIDQPVSFLENLTLRFPSGTQVLITVPAFQFLFSSHDTFLGHHRRYTLQTLKAEINDLISIDKINYIFLLPLLVRCFQRVFANNFSVNSVSRWGHNRKSMITRLTVFLLSIDVALPFPLGLSVFLKGKIK